VKDALLSLVIGVIICGCSTLPPQTTTEIKLTGDEQKALSVGEIALNNLEGEYIGINLSVSVDVSETGDVQITLTPVSVPIEEITDGKFSMLAGRRYDGIRFLNMGHGTVLGKQVRYSVPMMYFEHAITTGPFAGHIGKLDNYNGRIISGVSFRLNKKQLDYVLSWLFRLKNM